MVDYNKIIEKLEADCSALADRFLDLLSASKEAEAKAVKRAEEAEERAWLLSKDLTQLRKAGVTGAGGSSAPG